MTEEEQIADQLDFDDPQDDLQQEKLQEYVEDRMSEGESDNQEAEVDSESDEIDEQLINDALEVGLEPDDIDKLGSYEAIQNFIDIAKRQKGDVEEEKEQDPDFSLEYDLPEDTPDEVKKAVQGLVDKLEQKFAGLQEVFGDLQSRQESEQIQQSEAAFDQMIESVGEGFQGLFGTGPTGEMTEGSQFLENRVLLIEEMNALAAGYEAQGREMPDESTLMRRAIASAFTDDRDEVQAAQMRAAINSRRDAFTASPTQRRGRAMSPEAAAKQSVRSYMEKSGLLNGIDDPNDF